MTTDLEPVAEILDPTTGELINATDIPAVGDALSRARLLQSRLRNAIGIMTQAFVEESRRAGTKTLRCDGATYELKGGHEVEWDVEVLLELHDLGLPESRYQQLVSPVVTWKVNAAEARSIAASNPDYAEVIGRAKKIVEKPYYVSVKR
jgi:hypothetical protein